MRWADIEDDDCLVCEKCGIKEYTRAYCINCVNNMVQLMSLFQEHWDLSESAKERLYGPVIMEHRLTACAPHPGTAQKAEKAETDSTHTPPCPPQ